MEMGCERRNILTEKKRMVGSVAGERIPADGHSSTDDNEPTDPPVLSRSVPFDTRRVAVRFRCAGCFINSIR